MDALRANVIRDNRTQKLFWDDNELIRNFETLLDTDITYQEAKEKYGDIQDVAKFPD